MPRPGQPFDQHFDLAARCAHNWLTCATTPQWYISSASGSSMLRVLLRSQHDALIDQHALLQRGDRTLAPHLQWDDRAWKDQHSPERQERQRGVIAAILCHGSLTPEKARSAL